MNLNLVDDDKKNLLNDHLEFNKSKEDDIENFDIEEDLKSDSEEDIPLEDNNIEGISELFVRLLKGKRFIECKELISNLLKDKKKFKRASLNDESKDIIFEEPLIKTKIKIKYPKK